MKKRQRTEPASYEKVRDYLHEALEQTLAAGRSSRDFMEFTLEKFGRAIVPYLKRFQDEIRQGSVQVSHLTEAARTAVFGIEVSEEQRQQLVSEAAYHRAEARGFSGGSADEDWYAAEREVEHMLADRAGLLKKGRKVLGSATGIAEKELDQVRVAVGGWLERHHGRDRDSAP